MYIYKEGLEMQKVEVIWNFFYYFLLMSICLYFRQHLGCLMFSIVVFLLPLSVFIYKIIKKGHTEKHTPTVQQ